jgi:hypothetical protein
MFLVEWATQFQNKSYDCIRSTICGWDFTALIQQIQIRLLVKRLGVGGGGGDVGVTSGLVGAGGLLEGLGGSQVGVTGGGVLGGVVGETGVHGGAGKSGEHDCNGLLSNTDT